MAKRGFSVGMVALLIVMAVVLLMVAKGWKAVAPAALDTQDVLQSGPLHDHGQNEAADEVRSGGMPRLQETRQEADEHNARVEQALTEIE
jgi:hypothetical protein